MVGDVAMVAHQGLAGSGYGRPRHQGRGGPRGGNARGGQDLAGVAGLIWQPHSWCQFGCGHRPIGDLGGFHRPSRQRWGADRTWDD